MPHARALVGRITPFFDKLPIGVTGLVGKWCYYAPMPLLLAFRIQLVQRVHGLLVLDRRLVGSSHACAGEQRTGQEGKSDSGVGNVHRAGGIEPVVTDDR
ncbi:MAG: hypothetical protein IPI55_18230 [Flavobacteriales bacterium]|nr:hypothetical protein [Flavobacteriales bacterium]